MEKKEKETLVRGSDAGEIGKLAATVAIVSLRSNRISLTSSVYKKRRKILRSISPTRFYTRIQCSRKIFEIRTNDAGFCLLCTKKTKQINEKSWISCSVQDSVTIFLLKKKNRQCRAKLDTQTLLRMNDNNSIDLHEQKKVSSNKY